MSTIESTTQNGALPPLAINRQVALLRFAQFWVISTTVFTGVALALQAVVLAPYPGTDADPLMKTFAYTAVSALIATSLKFLVVGLWGERVESKLESHRPIRLAQAFSKDV